MPSNANAKAEPEPPPVASTIAIYNDQPRLVRLAMEERLIPGVTVIKREVWDRFKGLPVIQALLKEKKLEEAADLDEEGSLAPLKAHEAVKLIERTDDTKLLERWLDDENRGTIVKACRARIKAIDDEQLQSDEGKPLLV
jgi:hypothetical protein